LLCALGLPPAAASAAQPSGEPLAPSLQELAKPSVRSLPLPAQARLLGIAASGPGSVIREAGRVLVDARFEAGAIASLPALRQAGADVVASSQRYQEVTASVPFAELKGLAAVPGLASVTPVRTPVVRALEPCQGGSVISEGITQLKVEAAREKLAEKLGEPSKEGEGLTVGVLSDSFNQATEAVSGGPIASKAPDDIINKDLPGVENGCAGELDPVANLRGYEFAEGQEPPFDEGRAMLQIVHDVVPRAKLAFNSAFNGELAFAEGIEKLAAPELLGGAEADVIVDDVGYFEEPFFQDGPVAAAINKVVGEGVTYLSAAGNDNLFDAEQDEFASWEAPAYRDSGSCPAAVRAVASLSTSHCLDFNPEAPVDRTFGIKVKAGETLTVDLQWAEAWHDVDTNLDAFLLDAEGRLLTLAADKNLKSQKPVEILQWSNESAVEKTVQLVVNRSLGEAPRLKFILLENGSGVSGTEYPRSGGGDVVGPTVYGHAGAAAAIALGAVRFNNATEPEPYSSRGPVTHYFGPVEGTTPAPPLGSPEVISKPDAAATDCGRTTFFAVQAQPSIWRFCGTSAAAPHAAGIAALAIEAKGGGATPAGVEAALAGTGTAVGSFGPCAVGGGLLEAEGVVEAMRGEIAPTPPAACQPPSSGASVFVAPGQWGLETPPTPPVEPEKPVTPTTPPTTPTQPPTTQPPTVPSTLIRTHPPKVVHTGRALARVVFRFAAEPAAASFRCQFDGSPWRPCSATVARWFGLGQHVVRVQAKSADGLYDPTAAVFRFRVARNR
jgi:hypothetical protein